MTPKQPTMLLELLSAYVPGDRKRQQAAFAWSELVDEVRAFQEQLRSLLRAEGPASLPDDWKARVSEGE